MMAAIIVIVTIIRVILRKYDKLNAKAEMSHRSGHHIGPGVSGPRRPLTIPVTIIKHYYYHDYSLYY